MGELDTLRLCAILHDVGKPECWLKRKPWSEHVWYTSEILREGFGDEITSTAMRHHAGRGYREDQRPQNDLEKIICLADNIASGADRPEEPKRGGPLPKAPLTMSHVLSDGNVVRMKIDEKELSSLVMNTRQGLTVIGQKNRERADRGYPEVYNFLREQLSSLPADTRRPINDVTLWYHLKLTAAIATCMWVNGGYRGGDASKYEFSILSGDTDKVTSFINVSQRLPDLRARSKIVNKATIKAAEAIAAELGPECLLFAGGGGFLAISPSGKADTTLQRAKEGFESVARGELTVTVNYVKADGSEVKNRFGSLWKKAISAMHTEKLVRPIAPLLTVERDKISCDICGNRPGVHPTKKILPYDASPRLETLCDSCYKMRTSEDARGVNLGEVADEHDFVGIVNADGDDLGRVLDGGKIKEFKKEMTPSRLASISGMIHETCEGKLQEVVRRHGGECIYAGGDNVLAVLPGEKALGCAQELTLAFNKEMAGQLTMSAGVVIFKKRFPCYVALEIVSQLLRNAKEQEEKASIDFEIISAVEMTPEDVNLERREEQRKRGLTHKPYKWIEFGDLQYFSRMLERGGIPTSQLRTIAEIAIVKGKEEAQNQAKYQMGRTLIPWKVGEDLIAGIENGLFLDAFTIYNSLHRR